MFEWRRNLCKNVAKILVQSVKNAIIAPHFTAHAEERLQMSFNVATILHVPWQDIENVALSTLENFIP